MEFGKPHTASLKEYSFKEGDLGCGGAGWGWGGRGAKEEENDPIALISSFLVEEEKIHLFPSGHKRRVKRTVHQKTEMDYRELQTSLG